MHRRLSATFYLAVGWVTAVISLLFVPIVFGIIGALCGIRVYNFDNHKKSGITLIVFSIIFALLDFVLTKILS